MSNKILKYVRAVVFIAIVVGLVKCMDYAMMPSGYIRYIIHEADNADTDEGYDNIIIGASHARSAINPVKLDEAGASDNAFNLAIPGETVTDSYYLLMESDRHNKKELYMTLIISTGAIMQRGSLKTVSYTHGFLSVM